MTVAFIVIVYPSTKSGNLYPKRSPVLRYQQDINTEGAFLYQFFACFSTHICSGETAFSRDILH